MYLVVGMLDLASTSCRWSRRGWYRVMSMNASKKRSNFTSRANNVPVLVEGDGFYPQQNQRCSPNDRTAVYTMDSNRRPIVVLW